jgi:hypothetical protein
MDGPKIVNNNDKLRKIYEEKNKMEDDDESESVSSESSTPSDNVLRHGEEDFDMSQIPQIERTEILI